ncbi:hypothetical protein FIBSPDRAFT_970105 [Athelia psychrophila]|uniref:Uncharacterized protein n=1 Tax=Athelia psychrophila TaxID=1759441 RepID=A0A167SXK7_9AGAM|nr:hypothetical protein FIBSPDRAFT_970105 [Fibularhizoctonia sp. CBS 109695]
MRPQSQSNPSTSEGLPSQPAIDIPELRAWVHKLFSPPPDGPPPSNSDPCNTDVSGQTYYIPEPILVEPQPGPEPELPDVPSPVDSSTMKYTYLAIGLNSMVNMPPPRDIPSRPSLNISTGSRTSISGSSASRHSSRATSISRQSSRGQSKGKGRQASAGKTHYHSDRWVMPGAAGVEGMSMSPQPVKTDGSFITYESPGASSPSMAAESSEQAAGKRRRTDPSPGPSPRRQTASSSRRSSWAAPRAEFEATDIRAALVRESGMPAWVTEDLWERFEGNVERIRSEFQLIRAQWSRIAEITEQPIWVAEGAWLRYRGDLKQIYEAIGQLKKPKSTASGSQ